MRTEAIQQKHHTITVGHQTFSDLLANVRPTSYPLLRHNVYVTIKSCADIGDHIEYILNYV